VAIAADIDHVSVEKEGERYFLEGEVVVGASTDAVYQLITDYDALEKIDRGIVESRLLERIGDNVAMVYTRLKGCVVFFCRKIDRVERVEEISVNEVVAVVVPNEDGDVRYERSHWRLSKDKEGTRITYYTEVEPDFWIPAVIGPTLIKHSLRRRVARTLKNLEAAALTYE